MKFSRCALPVANRCPHRQGLHPHPGQVPVHEERERGGNLRDSLHHYRGGHPGQGARHVRLRHLEPLRSITQLAALLANELEASVSPDTPLLLAGHSMGAQVAFETCRLLEQRGLAPQGLIISGCHAPHLHSERQLSHRDDADFIAELIDIGGCSPELRENQELMSLFLPLLRADFYATESYHYDSPDVCPPLRTPALLLCGSHDREASWQQVDAWRQWLSHVTGPVVIDGDHFYPIQQARSFFTQIVRHFPHAFSAMTAWQKQPSTSER